MFFCRKDRETLPKISSGVSSGMQDFLLRVTKMRRAESGYRCLEFRDRTSSLCERFWSIYQPRGFGIAVRSRKDALWTFSSCRSSSPRRYDLFCRTDKISTVHLPMKIVVTTFEVVRSLSGSCCTCQRWFFQSKTYQKRQTRHRRVSLCSPAGASRDMNVPT